MHMCVLTASYSANGNRRQQIAKYVNKVLKEKKWHPLVKWMATLRCFKKSFKVFIPNVERVLVCTW